MTGGGAPSSSPSGSPSTRPRSGAETAQDIVKQRQTWQKYYPDITKDKLKDMTYVDIVNPLKNNPRGLPEQHEKFLKAAQDLENKLSNVGRRSYSYTEVERRISDKTPFAALKNQVDVIIASTGGHPPLTAPNYDILFSATTQAEFDGKMGDTAIVNATFAGNPQFVAKAREVFRTIQKYRKDNEADIQNTTVIKFIDDVFKAKDTNELKDFLRADSTATSSPIKALLDDSLRREITTTYDKYTAFKNLINEKLVVADKTGMEQRDMLTQPYSYYRSGEKWICDKFNRLSESFAGATGGQKVAFAALALFGTSMFLNSNHEGAVKLRGILWKSVQVGALAIGGNMASKVLFNKPLLDKAREFTKDKSGKRDFLKNSFNTNKEGAVAISESIVHLGNMDAEDVFAEYLVKYDFYRRNPQTPEATKELSLANVADTTMHPRHQWKALKLVDRKLRSQGSSIEDLHKALKEAREKAKKEGKPIDRPTYSQMITAILQNDRASYKVDKNGRITFTTTQNVETVWTGPQSRSTRRWWVLTGGSATWRDRLMRTSPGSPKEEENNDYLRTISSQSMDIEESIDKYMTDDRFGRFSSQYKRLYNLEYKAKPTEKFHSFDDQREKAGYSMSKVKLDTTTFRDHNSAKINAVQNAYKQGFDELQKKYIQQYTSRPDIVRTLRTRFHEFVQPIHGVFLAQKKTPPRTFGDKFNKPSEYVMFLRVALPDSLEFQMRDKNEWPDGNMREMSKNTPMQAGEKLTANDFKNLSSEPVDADTKTKYGVDESPYIGSYEAFLTKFKLQKGDNTAITRTLNNISEEFAGKGLTKKGLISHLASHNFDESEIKKFRGLSGTEKLPNQGHDRAKMVRQIIKDVMLEITSHLRGLETRLRTAGALQRPSIQIKISTLLKYKSHMVGGLDNLMIAMSNGDGDALARLNETMSLAEAAITFQVIAGTINYMGEPTQAQKDAFLREVLPRFKTMLTAGITDRALQSKLVNASNKFRQV